MTTDSKIANAWKDFETATKRSGATARVASGALDLVKTPAPGLGDDAATRQAWLNLIRDFAEHARATYEVASASAVLAVSLTEELGAVRAAEDAAMTQLPN